jgi:group I intron endonuclease
MRGNQMGKFGIIYKATNLINGKCYVGKTTKTLEERIKGHFDIVRYKKPSYYFHKALLKYGDENFKWEILCSCDDELLLNIRETMKIIVEHSHVSENGYNMTWGGEGVSGYKFTDNQKKKMSESHKGQIPWMSGRKHTEETRRKIKEAVNRNRKEISDETRLKLSKSSKGRKHSDETKRKISEYRKGKKLSEETRKKISESNKDLLKGDKHFNYGKHLSEETRKKISESNKGHVITDETRLKLSKSSKGRKHSDETKRKISKANKGKKHSDEHNKKMGESKRKYNDVIISSITEMLNSGISKKIIAEKINIAVPTLNKWIRTLIK